MEFYKTYFISLLIVMAITLSVTVVLKKRPDLVDLVIDRIVFSLMAILLVYACFTTDWGQVKKKLEKDLKTYQETQRNVWKFK